MAIDTEAKRRNVAAIGVPFPPSVTPSGGIEAFDRAQIAWTYGGNSISEPDFDEVWMSYDPIIAPETIDGRVWTYQDTVDHLIDFVGGSTEGKDARDARRSAQEGLRELIKQRRWSYFYTDFAIRTRAPYSTGTVEFDLEDGAYPNILTLSGGTWPSWAGQGRVRIAGNEYPAVSRKSDTVLQLHPDVNPGDDVAASEYTIYKTHYQAPDLLQAMVTGLVDENNLLTLPFVHPREWLGENVVFGGPSQPVTFTVMGSDWGGALGRPMIAIAPPPSSSRTFRGVCVRTARPLKIEQYNTGTVATTVASDTVTGTGTNWGDSMVGTCIRVSDTSTAPTGISGDNPYSEERIVLSVESATSLTVDSVFTASRSAVGYVISDPTDIDLDVMLTCYLRTCEWKMVTNRRSKDRADVHAIYMETLRDAMSVDARYLGRRMAGVMARMGFMETMTRMPWSGADSP